MGLRAFFGVFGGWSASSRRVAAAALTGVSVRRVDLVIGAVAGGAAFAVMRTLVSRWPGALLVRAPGPVAAVCLFAAAGAAFAPGEPTAVPAVDVLLRAGMATAVTAASARARRQVWLVAAAVTVAAATASDLDWLAFVAGGLTAAMLVLGRRSWVVGAVVGACLAQVLLRLEFDGPTGASAGVAAAVSALLIVSGLRRSAPRTRRRAWLVAGLLAGSAVVFTGAAGLAGLAAAGDGRDGIDAGEAGLRAARQVDVASAADRFADAATAFRRARVKLGRWWARPALAVPVVGQHLRAGRLLSRAGERLAEAVSAATAELQLPGLRLDRGAVDLAAVDRANGAVRSARTALQRARTQVDDARSPWLAAPLTTAIGDLDRRMAGADRDVGTAAEVLDLAGPMLGRDGPRRYLLAVVTPAENRGSGGLIGNTAEISATAGKLALTSVQRIGDLNEAVDDEAAARVLPAIYASAYGAWTVGADLQNATVPADFETAAEALEAVVPLAGRAPVDGTVSVDPLAVAALLEVTGPVSVGSWPEPITAANAASVLLHEQYVALSGPARESFLAEVVSAVWQRVVSGTLPSPATLAAALAPAVRGRHIQLHSRRGDEQGALGRLEADGNLPRPAGDHLALVTDNASESKADWFLRRAMDYRLQYDPGTGAAEGTVRVTLTNDAPPGGLPEYVLGGRLVPPGHNRQIVQVYTPLDLVSATVDGRPPPAALRSLGARGNWAHEVDVVVPAQSTAVVEFRLAGRLVQQQRGSWRLVLGRQPASHPDDVTVTLTLDDRWRIDSASGGLAGSGRSVSTQLKLTRNVLLGAQFGRK